MQQRTRSNRRTSRLAVVSVAVIASMSVGLAFAHNLDGAGTNPKDDWGSGGEADEHTLQQGGTVSQGNVVGVWQNILYADGFLGQCGAIGVDGIFGTNTRVATAEWQSDELLVPDGVVGPNTWGRADNYLAEWLPDFFIYDGFIRDGAFARPHAGGQYGWFWRSNSFTHTSHPGRDFNRC